MPTLVMAALITLALAACSSGPESEGLSSMTDSSKEPTMIMLAGDVMIGRGIDQILIHSVDPTLYEPYMRSAAGYVELAEKESGPIPRNADPGYIWGDALEILERLGPAARIINLETAVTEGGEPWPRKGIHYRTHPGNVDVLIVAGIDCAILANNHVLDWGRAGLMDSLEVLQNASVESAGAGLSLPDASKPATLETNEGRVLLFAMAHESSGVPLGWAAGPDRPGVRLLPDLSPQGARNIARAIGAVRRPGDRVVVSIHWGGNWGYEIPGEQIHFARTLIDEGAADLIHGHSSHHPKGIEIYKGRLIIYGAGDLINDYEGIGGHERFRPELSLLYFPILALDGQLESMLLVPFEIRRFRLNLAGREDAAWLRDRLAVESQSVEVSLREDGFISVRPKVP